MVLSFPSSGREARKTGCGVNTSPLLHREAALPERQTACCGEGEVFTRQGVPPPLPLIAPTREKTGYWLLIIGRVIGRLLGIYGRARRTRLVRTTAPL